MQATPDETEQPLTFGITQVRGNPDHFILCADCPVPTQKTQIRITAKPGKESSVDKAQLDSHKLVVHFDHASSVVKGSDRDALARLVNTLPAFYRLTITGYTDNSASDAKISNATLALQRARSVMAYLIELGVDKNAITIKESALCCYIDANATESGRARNRRAEIIVTLLSNGVTNP
jgi:outer membrane protein OmpA-like peptidoglycan-associated protein